MDLKIAMISVDGQSVVVEAFKKSQNGEGYILRVYEAKGGRGKVKVNTAFAIGEVWETNLMEEKEERLELDENRFAFTIKPYEIKTFLIK